MLNFNKDAKRTKVNSGIFKDETHIYHLPQKVTGKLFLMTAQCPNVGILSFFDLICPVSE